MKGLTKPIVRIENWYVDLSLDRLIGVVYEHPNIPDGEEVTTSRLVDYDPKTNTALIETQNTIYKLGVPRR